MVSAIAYGGVLDSFADLDLTYLFTFSIECRETKTKPVTYTNYTTQPMSFS